MLSLAIIVAVCWLLSAPRLWEVDSRYLLAIYTVRILLIAPLIDHLIVHLIAFYLIVPSYYSSSSFVQHLIVIKYEW